MNPRPTNQTDCHPTSIRTIVAASAIGTTIEWYDFLIYATAASLVLNKLFFPTEDPLVGKLAPSGSASSPDRSGPSC